jgi:hypothetical protein
MSPFYLNHSDRFRIKRLHYFVGVRIMHFIDHRVKLSSGFCFLR